MGAQMWSFPNPPGVDRYSSSLFGVPTRSKDIQNSSRFVYEKKKNTREIKKKKKTLSKQEQNKDETNKQTKKLKAILVCIFMVFPYRSIYLFILSFVINVVFFDFLQTR